MSTCATCKFWNRNGDPHEYYDSEGDPHTSEHKRCLRILHGNKGSDNLVCDKQEQAFVVDGSGYAASLKTLPTFGCQLHEEDEAENEEIKDAMEVAKLIGASEVLLRFIRLGKKAGLTFTYNDETDYWCITTPQGSQVQCSFDDEVISYIKGYTHAKEV